MRTVPFVMKIKKDWRYPHRENAFQFAERPPSGFQTTEAPDWVTGTVRGTIPDPAARDQAPGNFEENARGMIPGGAVGSLFDEHPDENG